MIKPDGSSDRAPNFLVTGVRLFWNDGSPAYLRQSSFRWVDSAWEASLEILHAPSDGAIAPASAILRLSPAVVEAWRERSCEPIFETCRQVQDAIRAHANASPLGVIELIDTHDWIAEEWFRDAIAARVS